MSIVDHNGRPVAYGWNDIAAQERYESDGTLRLMADEEFERRFPDLFCGRKIMESRRKEEEGECSARGS